MSPKNKNLEAYILQENLKQTLVSLLGIEDERGNNESSTPQTSIMETTDWLRVFPKNQLLLQAKEQGLVLPNDEVEKWGLRNGDLIQLSPNKTKLEVVKVNGIENPKISVKRPHIVGVDALDPTYAEEKIPLENYGDVSVRAFTWLAPIGKGHRLFIVAPPGTGKTWIVRSVWESCLKMTNDDNRLYVIGLHVGERAEDGTALKKIREETDHDDSRSEFYSSPDGDPEEAHFYLTQYVVNRARRLCEGGYDVVLAADSFSRVLMSHSRATGIPKPPNAGMIAGGVSTASITEVKRLLSVAGNFPQGSLTIVATMLGSGKSSNQRSSETSLYDETGPSTSTSLWFLVDYATTPFPKIDVSNTFSREYQRICTEKELEQMRKIKKRIFDNARPDQALQRLITLSEKYIKRREEGEL